jgi:hypothetical protein
MCILEIHIHKHIQCDIKTTTKALFTCIIHTKTFNDFHVARKQISSTVIFIQIPTNSNILHVLKYEKLQWRKNIKCIMLT